MCAQVWITTKDDGCWFHRTPVHSPIDGCSESCLTNYDDKLGISDKRWRRSSCCWRILGNFVLEILSHVLGWINNNWELLQEETANCGYPTLHRPKIVSKLLSTKAPSRVLLRPTAYDFYCCWSRLLIKGFVVGRPQYTRNEIGCDRKWPTNTTIK